MCDPFNLIYETFAETSKRTEGQTLKHKDGWLDGGQLQQCEGDRLTHESRTSGVKPPERSQQEKQQTPPSANAEEEEKQQEEDGGRGREGEFIVN